MPAATTPQSHKTPKMGMAHLCRGWADLAARRGAFAAANRLRPLNTASSDYGVGTLPALS